MPKVAIVLVNWNGWRDTIACLQSLSRQRYPNAQIVVVDNCSTDQSTEKIRSSFPGLEVLETSRNLGFAGGCNVGIRHALKSRPEYVWLLNNDTRVHPSALMEMVLAAQSDQGIGAIGAVLRDLENPDRVQAWGGGWVSLWLGVGRHLKARPKRRKLAYISGASLMLRREALEAVGLLDEQFFLYWEDADLCFRLRASGWRLVVAEGAVVWHSESSSVGRDGRRRDIYSTASAVQFFQKYAPIPFVPTLLGIFGARVLKRLMLGRWSRAAAVIEGLRAVHGRGVERT